MNDEAFEEKLLQIPIEERAEAREFVRMEPFDQRFQLYSDSKDAKVLLGQINATLSEISKMVTKLNQPKTDFRTQVGGYLYTTVVLVGIIAAAVLGKIPTVPGWIGP